MQFFVCLFVLFIKSQGKTDAVISSLIKGQTEIWKKFAQTCET